MESEHFFLTSQPFVANRPLVLAVDDDDDSLLLLMKVLELLQCSFITATNGQTALSLARSSQPDLILMDILLPDLHGTAVVRDLKSHPLTNKIPIVALTALAKTQDQQSILAAGCDHCLIKPYLLEELEAVIQQYVG